MKVDCTMSKNKITNLFLRIIQLSIQLISGFWATKYQIILQCDYTISNIISYISYGLACLNVGALIAMKFGKRFPKILFFLVLSLDFMAAVAIIVVEATKGNLQCVAAKVYQQFAIIESGNALIISTGVLLLEFVWGQRYSNAPGNIAWPILFLSYQWSTENKAVMLIIGIVTAVICVMTVLFHIISFVKSGSSKLLTVDWELGIVLLVILQIIAIVKYLYFGNSNEYIDMYAKETLMIFIAVNLFDILFWLWGLRNWNEDKPKDSVKDESLVKKSGYKNYRTSRLVTGDSILVSHQI